MGKGQDTRINGEILKFFINAEIPEETTSWVHEDNERIKSLNFEQIKRLWNLIPNNQKIRKIFINQSYCLALSKVHCRPTYQFQMVKTSAKAAKRERESRI